MSDILSIAFWLFIFFTAILPMFRQRQLEAMRTRLIRDLEQKRGSRVITMIHRQETLSFLGIPIYRFINVEDSEAVLRAIRLTEPHVPIDLVLHTPGGLVLAASQIARALKGRAAAVTVFVPHYAMSGGTLIALAADQIVMDENAALGPIDPQLARGPDVAVAASSVLAAIDQKPRERVDDITLILGDVAHKAIAQIHHLAAWLLRDRYSEEDAGRIAEALSEGRWTHDFPLTVDALAELGVKVSTDLPIEVYRLMDYYPQAPQRRPSVEFIPMPYGPQDRRPAA